MAFQKGQSGNPRGRPKGGTDKRTAARNLLEPHKEALLNKAVELALIGDTTALRLCIDRICPAIKATEQTVIFDLPKGKPLADSGNAILQAASKGQLSPQQAQALLSALAQQAKIIEIDELERRVEALEERKHEST